MTRNFVNRDEEFSKDAGKVDWILSWRRDQRNVLENRTFFSPQFSQKIRKSKKIF
jgi:hypothetical protein